ncbi:MAG TPA: DoxX family membrane protein [Puia sp.]|nr:DoxX family membrane protein [Puia sp.]
MRSLTTEQKIHYTLRIAIAMCFIGHGAFGIITKPIWCNYFAVFGIGKDLAYRLMPVLGSFDILLGLIMLVYPMRIIPLWLVIWGVLTAALRPLSGEPFAELIERAGNFGAPLAFLILSGSGGKGIRGWIARVPESRSSTRELRGSQYAADNGISRETLAKLTLCLRIVVFLLLLGHGWLNILQKKGLLGQYASLGISSPDTVALYVGLFEIVAACAVLIRPLRPVLLGLFIWKMSSELFYPHYEPFEWVERGGSYGAILALWLAIRQVSAERYVTLAT